MSEICFIEARPRVVATGAETVVRLAGGGTVSRYYRGGQHYRAGVVEMPRFRAAFGFDDNGWTGGTVPTSGVLGFNPGDTSLIPALSAYYWRDAAITIDAGEESAALVRRLTGTIAGIATVDGQLALTLVDPSKLLDKPLLGTGFTGAGGIEGPAEAAGRAKRRSWGLVFNVEGNLLDKANNIHEFGDPAHGFAAFTAVRDKGREGPMVLLAWQGSVAATFAALKAAAAPDGGCVVAPSIACVKWWTVPAGPLTADIQGEDAEGYVDTAVAIAAKMLAAVEGPAIVNQAAAAALRAATCGIHIASATDTVAQALDRLLLGCSLYWVLQPDGTIRIGEWAWTVPVAAFQAQFIGRERQLPPIKSRQVGYRRNHRQHSASEISAAVLLADDVAYLDGTPIEDLQPAEPGATDGATVGDGDNPGNVKDQNGVVRPASDLLNRSLMLSADGLLAIVREGDAPTPLGQVRAAAIGAASDASLRSNADALERLSAIVTMIDTRLASTQEIIRDAGIYVDPTTGMVTISALDATEDRVNDVSVQLDAVRGSLVLKASTTYVDAAIAAAVIDPSQIPVFDQIEARITTAETRLDGAEAAILLKADAVTLTALTATVTTVSEDLDALAGVVATKVDSVDFGTLETRVANAEDSLTALGDTAELARGVSVARMTGRQVDDEAALSLAGLLAGDARQRGTIAALAVAREEITARLIEGDGAEARARQALAVRVGAAESGISGESLLRASETSALARRADLVEAGLATETSNRQAEVADERQARIDADNGLSVLVGQKATITSVDALSTRVGTAEDTIALHEDALTSQAARVSTIEVSYRNAAQVNAAVNAAVTAEANLRANADGVLATNINNVSTTVNGHTATLETFGESIDGLSVRYGLRLNAGGKVIGWVANNDGVNGGMDFVVDYFRLWNAAGTTSKAPFEFVGGSIFMASAAIKDLSVETIKIANNAITFPVHMDAPSVFLNPASGEQTLLESAWLELGTIANPATALVGFYATLRTDPGAGGGPDNAADFKVYCDTGAGYQLMGAQAVGIEATGGNVYYWVPVSVIDLASNLSTARFKVTGTPIAGPQGRPARRSLVGAPTLVIQGSKR